MTVACFHAVQRFKRAVDEVGKREDREATLPEHARWTVLKGAGTVRTQARLEGFKSLFQAARSKARGYRNVKNFITMVSLIAAQIQVIVTS